MRFENFGGFLLKTGCTAVAVALITLGSVSFAENPVKTVTTTVSGLEAATGVEVFGKAATDLAAGSFSPTSLAKYEAAITQYAGVGAYAKLVGGLSILAKAGEDNAAAAVKEIQELMDKHNVPLSVAITAVTEQSGKGEDLVEAKKLTAFRDIDFSVARVVAQAPTAPALPTARQTAKAASRAEGLTATDAEAQIVLDGAKEQEFTNPAAADLLEGYAACKSVASKVEDNCSGKTVCALKDSVKKNMNTVCDRGLALRIVNKAGFKNLLKDLPTGFNKKYDLTLVTAAFAGALSRGYLTLKNADPKAAVQKVSNANLGTKSSAAFLNAEVVAVSEPRSIIEECVNHYASKP